MKIQRIALVTKNASKVAEFAKEFDRYGLEVVQHVPSADGFLDDTNAILQLLTQQADSWVVQAVVREEQHVFKIHTDNVLATLEDLETVTVRSKMDVWRLSKSSKTAVLDKQSQMSLCLKHPGEEVPQLDEKQGDEKLAPANLESLEVEHAEYSFQVDGFIDLSKKIPNSENVFGWDDIFVVKSTGLTYHEQKLAGYKVSPRNVNISAYIKDFLHYKKRRNLAFNPRNFNQTVQFDYDNSVTKFVLENEFMNNPVAKKTGLHDVFVAVVNNGAFFRSAKNRRQVNYWLPGLNAGIPFVQKKDPIHEITFMAHDFGHFLIPDLVFTGNYSANVRRTYIIYRMMSEATTLVFADMLFVDTLKKSGFEYDWSKRRIYPLFQATGIDPFSTSSKEAFFDAFKTLLRANVHYCLLGDDSVFAELIKKNPNYDWPEGTTCKVLDLFKDKYMPFFVEDFRWTTKNFENMVSRKEEFGKWWNLVSPIRDAANLNELKEGVGLETVDDHMRAIGIDHDSVIDTKDLVLKIFDRVFETRIRPVFSHEFRLEKDHVVLKNSFSRYIIGQMIIFAKFDFIPESKLISERLVKYMVENANNLTLDKISRARGFYNLFLTILQEKSLITPDDCETFSDVCPLFEPNYVFYDEKKSFYESLAEVQKRILS